MNKNEKSDLPLLIEFCVELVLLPLLTIIYTLLPWIEIGKRGEKNEEE